MWGGGEDGVIAPPLFVPHSASAMLLRSPHNSKHKKAPAGGGDEIRSTIIKGLLLEVTGNDVKIKGRVVS